LDGYQMDLDFPDQEALKRAVGKVDDKDDVRWNQVSPIQSQADLILYADRVAGSVADMILHLTWNILTSEPVTRETKWALSPERKETLRQGRKMGQALQLVNIARDVRTDAESIGRIYIPMEWFRARGRSGKHQLRSLANNKEATDEAFEAPRYTLPLLHIADGLRSGSADAIETLPRTARAGTRAMVVSYFEIGQEVRRRGGQAATLKEGRLRVSKRRRLLAVLWSIWGW
jgi:15-cis-phytoene synthase/lycopene beta-cyclase